MAFKDSVDSLIDEWAQVAPGLDTSPIAVLNRLRIVDRLASRDLEPVLAAHGLRRASFAALSTLYRLGKGASATQRQMADRLGLTPGTMSVRVEQMESDGLLERVQSEQDSRSTLVRLSEKGEQALAACVDAYLEAQRNVLLPLSGEERDQLAGLLKKLMAGIESGATHLGALGVTLQSARKAIDMRKAVGLEAKPGLIVESVDADSRFSRAEIMKGDLLIELNGNPLTSIVDLAQRDSDDRMISLTVLRAESIFKLEV